MAASHPYSPAGNQRATAAAIVGRGWLVTGLLWTSAPLATLAMATLTVLAGIVPSGTALLNRALLNGLAPRIIGRGGHRVLPHGSSDGHLAFLAVLLGCLGLAAAGIPHARRYAQGQLLRETGLLILDRMYQAINSFPGLSRFESPAFSDKIRLAQQISSTTAATLLSAATTCGQSVVTGITMFVLLLEINPVLAVIVAGMAVPAVAAQAANSRKSAGLEWQKSPAIRRQLFYGQLLAGARAAKEIRLFGLGDFLRGRMLGELRSVNRAQRALDLRICSIEGLLALMDAFVTAAGLIWVVGQAAAGLLPIGDVAMFVMAVVGVQNAIGGLVGQMSGLYQSLLLFGHYLDVVGAGPDLALATEPRALPVLREGIEIRDVWFRYDDAHPWVLRGVSLFIPSGSSVALIGLNGAGKSTLVKLLCRLYDPQRGSIRWDGVDIRDVAVDELRRRIGTVFQDYMSYDLTAAENIAMGDLDRLGDQARICGAARRAGVHGKLASLPRGYDTMLSRVFFSGENKDGAEAGVILSGGEWQRLALARGLMRADRDLLILDEPSSGLDAEAEHAIHQRLSAIRPGRASLLISHRLGSVRDAHIICVLSGGRITEQGTHQELMDAGGEYGRLFTLQASGYQEPAGDSQGRNRAEAAVSQPAAGADLRRIFRRSSFPLAKEPR
jgi:ATP-binding cassette, subfamily B, bacterial